MQIFGEVRIVDFHKSKQNEEQTCKGIVNLINESSTNFSSIDRNTSQVLHSFEIALLNLGAGQASSFTTGSAGLSAGPVRHIFDFPNGWTSLDGVRISNPENSPVAVAVSVIFHRQVMDSLWQGILYLGLSLAGIGAVMVGFAVHKSRHRLSE